MAEQYAIDLVNQQGQQMKDLLSGQRDEATRIFQNYQGQINSQEKLPAIYGRLQTELGIPGLSSTVQGYKDQINQTQMLLGNLTGDVTSRNRGSLTTDSQQNRQIAAEGSPLRTQLANLGYGMQPSADLLAGAQSQLSTLLQLNAQQQDKELKPVEAQINSLSDRYAREISGYSEHNQAELTALMDKLQRDRTLSDREWQVAQDRAAEERQFQHSLALAKNSLSNGLSMPAASAAPAAGGGKSMIDWLSLGGGGGGGGGLSVGGSSGLGVQGGGVNLQGGGGFRLQ